MNCDCFIEKYKCFEGFNCCITYVRNYCCKVKLFMFINY